MIVVKNKIIPPAGFKALTVWPFLFVRAKYITKRDIRHEEIHGCQQRELLVVGFLVLYCLFWVWKFIEGVLKGQGSVLNYAYKQNPLEREAYFFEGDEEYLERRKLFAWVTYLKL